MCIYGKPKMNSCVVCINAHDIFLRDESVEDKRKDSKERAGISITPREFYKERHPEFFSDSTIVEKSKLTKEMLNVHLETVTNLGQEKDFETFCRRIASKEICPNLLPQTGPTGGGDSKVDSETFPVSEEISETWIIYDALTAGQERWAFAFSAKKKWKEKCRSDIAKIHETNIEQCRGYSKAFFISSQFISDKQRSEQEDALRNQYNLDVRILDRGWLLDRVFTNGHELIAIDSFHMDNALAPQIKVGPNDIKREEKLAKIEAFLANRECNTVVAAHIAPAIKAAKLSRNIEKPHIETIGRFERAYRLSRKYGISLHEEKCIYEWAKTLYWWHEDFDGFIDKYAEFASLALASPRTDALNDLVTLWLCLFRLSIDESLSCGLASDFMESQTLLIEKRVEEFVHDESMPLRAKEARSIQLRMQLFRGCNIDSLIEEYIHLLQGIDSNLDFDFQSVANELLQNPMLKNAKKYDDLFELLTQKRSDRSRRITSAKEQVKRARDIYKERPYMAISYLGRAIADLFFEESKDELIRAFMLMAECFQLVGCYYASRNYMLHTLLLCLQEYERTGYVYGEMMIASYSLKFYESRLGNVMKAIGYYELELTSRALFEIEHPMSEHPIDRADEEFDPLISVLVTTTPFNMLPCLTRLPSIFAGYGLLFSELVAKYMLGYYDEDYLVHHNNDLGEYDLSIEMIHNQPARLETSHPARYGLEKRIDISSKIMGCLLHLSIDNNFICYELGCSLLSILEGFFATALKKSILVVMGNMYIEIEHRVNGRFSLELIETGADSYKILCSDYGTSEFISAQRTCNDFLETLLYRIVSKIIGFKKSLNSIEELIIKENALSRALMLTNSLFQQATILGKDFFSYERFVEEASPDDYPLVRKEMPEFFNSKKSSENAQVPEKPFSMHFATPIEKTDFNIEKVSQAQIHVSTFINISDWNKAIWKGVGYIVANGPDFAVLLLVLVFENMEAATKILNSWKKELGDDDRNDKLQLVIVKGIDRSNPYAYRIGIMPRFGSDYANNGKPQLIQCLYQLHTMEPKDDRNLSMFENVLKRSSSFILTIMDYKLQPEYDSEMIARGIRKNKSCVTIINAWEIEENSFLLSAISPGDNPIIPEGYEESPLAKRVQELGSVDTTGAK